MNKKREERRKKNKKKRIRIKEDEVVKEICGEKKTN